MQLTRTYTLGLFKVLFIVAVIALIIFYAVWRSINYAKGPHIDIFDPADGSSVTDSTVLIRGRIERANNLFLNGNAVSIDEQGNFNERLIVFPGLNLISIQGKDQFGRTTSTEIRLVGLTSSPDSSGL